MRKLFPLLIVVTFFACVSNNKQKPDWLINSKPYKSEIVKTDFSITLTNGLISRTVRLKPNGATTAYDNLMTGETIIRGVKPEASIVLDGKQYLVGGLDGQEEYGYLRPEWVDSLTSNSEAFQLYDVKTGKIKKRFNWKQKRYNGDLPWPPPGVSLRMEYKHADEKLKDITVYVNYELYDSIPLMCKWIEVKNSSKVPVRLNSFVSEYLAVVESEVTVENNEAWSTPNIHIESDFEFHGMTPKTANVTAHWVPDSQYASQVNYQRLTPCLLECRLPTGPNVFINKGETFESFRTWELIYDTTERERKGLALRKMYRTIAPWVTENPIFMHVTDASPEAIRTAIDQCAEVGFEMLIISFGSGLNMEIQHSDYKKQYKELVDYAHKKGVELGGYSLLASRKISEEHDVINPKTGTTGGAIFGNSPCLCSQWGEDYFDRIYDFCKKTEFDLLEHDGSYPGDPCASTSHPFHDGLEDSQWNQWRKITDFYKWCRGRGIFLNVPDWYFLSGSNKTGMGYRETNWSLPRDRQIILGRQNIYDGTWEKTPSMGWMFVPLVEYHGGGAAATLEPLSEHLDAYEAHLAQNFGSGVIACYRGPRLYDTDETKELVIKWVDFYKKYRDILNSDIIHLRRPDGRDLDYSLHVNPNLKEKGLVMVYNPTDKKIEKDIQLALYYTGLTQVAKIREKEGDLTSYKLKRDYSVAVPVNLGPKSNTWFVIE
jgi:hypothetical protein